MNAMAGDPADSSAGSARGRDAATEVTVAVTGPTGAIGKSVIRALERDDRVGRILGMARRPFEPAFLGWRKTKYRRGDVLDRGAVEDLVAGADVVVHLAYAIVGSRRGSGQINLTGSRNVFEAAVRAGRPNRLVYTSSVAAYGYHGDNPVPLTEDVPARGSPEHYYSAHKAASEALLAEVTNGSATQVYVLRPCIVAGPDAIELLANLQLGPTSPWLPEPARQLLSRVPGLRSVMIDPGVPIQLVHHDDVGAAVHAATLGAGPPGTYNLAAADTVTMTDLARAVGSAVVPVPHALTVATSVLLAMLPWLPAEAEWVHAARYPVLMDTTRARRVLGWNPSYTARETLTAMADALSG